MAVSDLTITRVLNVYHTRTETWAMPKPVNRKSNGLVYLEKGSITYHFESGDETATEGDLLIFPKDLHYCGTKNTKSQSYYVIDFETLTGQGLAQMNLPRVIKGEEWLKRMFEECEGAWKAGKIKAALRCKEHLYALLAELVEKTLKVDKKSGLFAQAVGYIHRNYTDPGFATNNVISAFHISPSQLRRIFQKEMNMPPVQYILSLRLELAKNLLRHECLSVKETALRCGFASEAYFSRMFKGRIGVCPSDFH